jgi:hypothetical protein
MAAGSKEFLMVQNGCHQAICSFTEGGRGRVQHHHLRKGRWNWQEANNYSSSGVTQVTPGTRGATKTALGNYLTIEERSEKRRIKYKAQDKG